MANAIVQRSFAGGIISPALWGRADHAKFAAGVKTCTNWIISRYGSAISRPGFEFVGEVKDSDDETRLLHFAFNAEQTYVLEFGDLSMRVIRAGGQVLESALTITGATAADPVVVTSAGHGLSNGDEVYITGVVGMTQLNGRNYLVANQTANTFELQDLGGVDIDGSAYIAYSSGGTAARVYTIVTPYAKADLFQLRFVQSGDTVTITHPSYAPRQLTRTGHASWTLALVDFVPANARPTAAAVASGGAGANTYKYKVTAFDEESQQDSLPGLQAAVTITGATAADPVVISATSHGYAAGDEVYIEDVVGMTELNDRHFIVANPNANDFELQGEDGSAHTAYVSGGTAKRTHAQIASAAAPTVSAPHTVSWTAASGAKGYNVFKEANGVYGWIGMAEGTSFLDTGYTPDATDTPPIARNPFRTAANYPSVVGYFQQRQVYGNTTTDPEKVWASRTGDYTNFTIRNPIQDDDAVTFTPAGRQVNRVRALIEIGRLVLLTEGGEFTVNGDQDGVLVPTAINLRRHSEIGCADVEPLVVGNTALFVQARSSLLYDLIYAAESDGYTGRDLSVFAPHLFEGKTIIEMAYARMPFSVVWIVRSDGVLLGLTYVREHDVWAWHEHTTDGTVESVAVVSEGNEDVLYVVVKRTVDSRTVRYIERLHSRTVANIATDAFFVDSGLSYDGWNTDTSHTMILSTGSVWTYGTDLTLTSSDAAYFTAAEVGNAIHLRIITAATESTPESTAILRCEITAFTSGAMVTARAHKDAPAAFQAVALSDWGRAVDELTNLHHLEGEALSIMADGHAVANGRDAPLYTVAAGAITLDQPYVSIHAGLPIPYQNLELLDVETLSAESLIDKRKRVNAITALVEDSRGFFAGPDADHLDEIAQRGSDDWDEAIAPVTGPVELPVQSAWGDNGRVYLRVSDPVPVTVLSVVRRLEVGK